METNNLTKESAISTSPTPRYRFTGNTFGTVDYVVLVVLTVICILVGTLAALRRGHMKTTTDFLLGGRNMHPVPVALSLLGGVVSAISILGNASEMYAHGTQLTLNLLGCVWGTLIVTQLLLPVLYPLKLVSMYKYLLLRYRSRALQKLSSLNQLLNSFFYLGICLYAPSLTLSSVTSVPPWAAIVLMGIVCSIYVSIGGVRAVVYTDVLQTTIMFVGVLVVAIKATVDLGGFQNVWTIADEGGRIEFFNLDTSPLTRHTFWNAQVLGMYFIVSVVAISQPQFQRLVSVPSLKASIGVCYMFLFGLFALWTVFYYSGISAYATYADCDPLTLGYVSKGDEIIPFMVVDKLGYLQGVAGLFVAAVYGGVLSSVSTQANAIATMVWEDFLKEIPYFGKMSDANATKVTKVLSALSGLVAILLAMLVSNLGGLFQMAYSISGALVGPLDGLFVTSITGPWVTTKGAISGFVVAFLFNMFLLVGKFVYVTGKSSGLPLSTEGCPSDVLEKHVNSTVALAGSALNFTTSTTPAGGVEDESNHWPIFDVSYCYNGAIGILVTFIFSTLVSLATGANSPNDVDPRLVHGGCLSLYARLWKLLNRSSGSVNITLEDKLPPEAADASRSDHVTSLSAHYVVTEVEEVARHRQETQENNSL